MFEEIVSRVRQLPGHIGLYICDLTSGGEAAFQAEDPIEAASVIKLTVLAEGFRQAEEGRISLEQEIAIRKEDMLPSCGALTYMHEGLRVTVRDLLTLMIILSDNTATNLLIDLLGIESINATIRSLGLTGTQLNRKLFQPHLARQGIRNYVTAADMGRLLRMIWDGRLVSAEASKDMLDILFKQRLNGKIPFFLHSRDIRVAHKTGEDDGITHDVGIIAGEKPVILCFLSEKTDVPAAERALQDAAATAAGVDV